MTDCEWRRAADYGLTAGSGASYVQGDTALDARAGNVVALWITGLRYAMLVCTSFSTGLRAYLRMSRVLERRSFCNDRFDTVFSLQIPSLGLHANLTENAKCAFTLSYVLRAACRR